MSADPQSRAAELAAGQVESIVSAAQKAAEGIRAEAERERAELRREAEREAERIRDEAQREADTELTRAHEEAAKVQEDTSKQVADRLAAAEKAADDALADARAMSQGLRRLGSVLSEQAERMLRDVQAAHRSLTSELRVVGSSRSAPGAAPPAASGASRPRLGEDEAAKLTELAERERAKARGRRERPLDRGEESAPLRRAGSGGERANPFDEIDVPSWVEPS